MLWLKAIHVIFMVAWFAGLFYLPRLFVYHADARDEASRSVFKVMERKLYRIIMNPACVITILTGFWMLFDYAWAAYRSSGWLHAKLALVVLLLGFHYACGRWVKAFEEDKIPFSSRTFRFINEIPTLILFVVVILVIVKPF